MSEQTQVITVETRPIVNHHANSEELRVIRAMFDPSNQLNDEQIKLFLHVAKEKKLDPRLKQICAIPKYNKATGRVECVIITQIDGFRMIAERTGRYAPGRNTEYNYDKNGRLLFATSYVKKLTPDGAWHEIGETAYFNEYNANSPTWRSMPHVMLAKCAEARALRRAFPGDLSGIYGQEEMDQALSAVSQEQPKIEDPRIPEEKAKEIDAWINGRDDIRKAILNLCKVNTVYEIKESQLEACRNYVAKRKGNNENNTQKQLPAPTA